MNSVSGTQAELPHRARFSLLLFTSLAVAVGGFFCILILHPDRPLALSLMLGSRGAVAANFAYAYSPALTWAGLTRLAYRRYGKRWRWFLLGAPFALFWAIWWTLFIGICSLVPTSCAGI